MDEGNQKVQTSIYKISPRDVMYSMVTTINNVILYILKLLTVLKVLITRKKICNCVLMDIYQTYCGDHCAIHTNIKSLCGIPETIIILHINYISIKKRDINKKSFLTAVTDVFTSVYLCQNLIVKFKVYNLNTYTLFYVNSNSIKLLKTKLKGALNNQFPIPHSVNKQML